MIEETSKWKAASLSELVVDPRDDIVDGPFGSRLKASEYVASGVPIVRLQNVDRNKFVDKNIKFVTPKKASEIARHHFVAGDVLVSKLGDPLGEACIAPPSIPYGILVADVVRVRPNKSKVDTAFLTYALNSTPVVAQFEAETKGTTRPRVNLRKIRDLQIPILESLDEQREIVAEIEKQFTRLEAGVAGLRRVQANLKRYRAAVLKAACEGKLVATEAEWPQKQIATAIQSMDQGWSPKCDSEPSNSSTIWAVIKTTAIQNLRFLEEENKTLPAALKPREHLELVPGDLLVTRAGPRSRVGVACLVKNTRPRLMLCDKAYRLRCKPTVAHPPFLELVLNAPHIVDEVNKLKTGISDSGVNLTQKRFGELLVPLPPLSEQTRVVAEVERRLSVVEELEAVANANLQRATRLRQSILQQAFEGKLVRKDHVDRPSEAHELPLAAESPASYGRAK